MGNLATLDLRWDSAAGSVSSGPERVQGASNFFNDTATTCTVTLGVPSTSGNHLIAITAKRFHASATTWTSPGAGWTRVGTFNGAGNRPLAVWWKAAAGESSVTFTTNTNSCAGCFVYEYSGLDPLNPFDQVVYFDETDNDPAGNTSALGPLTPTNADALILAIVAQEDDDFTDGTPPFSNSFEQIGTLSITEASSNDLTVAVAERIVDAAAAYSTTYAPASGGNEERWGALLSFNVLAAPAEDPACKAIQFNTALDGDNYLKDTDGPTGAADGKEFTFSGWMEPTIANGRFLLVGGECLLHNTGYVYLSFENASGTKILEFQSAAGLVQYSLPRFYHLMFSFDLADTGKRHVYLDGVDIAAGGTWTTYTNENMDLTRQWNVGGLNNEFAGCLGEFWMDDGYVDLSVTANREKFLKDGKAVYAGDTGERPTGASPLYYLLMDSTDPGANVGTGGAMTVNGALATTCGNVPTRYQGVVSTTVDNIYLSSSLLQAVYFGSSLLQSVYKGAQRLWPQEPDPPPTGIKTLPALESGSTVAWLRTDFSGIPSTALDTVSDIYGSDPGMMRQANTVNGPPSSIYSAAQQKEVLRFVHVDTVYDGDNDLNHSEFEPRSTTYFTSRAVGRGYSPSYRWKISKVVAFGGDCDISNSQWTIFGQVKDFASSGAISNPIIVPSMVNGDVRLLSRYNIGGGLQEDDHGVVFTMDGDGTFHVIELTFQVGVTNNAALKFAIDGNVIVNETGLNIGSSGTMTDGTVYFDGIYHNFTGNPLVESLEYFVSDERVERLARI